MQKPSEWFALGAEIADRLTPRWAKAGALAALEYRLFQRLTTDADMLIEWHEGLIPALEAAGYTLRVIRDPAVEHPHLIVARRGEERLRAYPID